MSVVADDRGRGRRDSRMKILQVHNLYRVGGGENVVLDRDRAELEAAGHEVVRHTQPNEGSVSDTVLSLAMAPWNPLEARKISMVLDEQQPDIVHVHNTWFRMSPAVIRAASRAGYPIVQTLHNYRWLCVNGEMLRDGQLCRDCVTGNRSSAVRHGCYRDSTPLSIVAATTGAVADRRGVWKRDIDRFITLTPAAKDLFTSWGFPKDRLVVRPHRIDDPGERASSPSQSDTVLYVGRVTDIKGVARLCAAWSRSERPYRLVIVGDGPIEARLRSSYPDIEFRGRMGPDEVLGLMRQSRALMLPTEWEEGFPLVVVEALATGLPVALSSIAIVRDYVARIGPEWVFDVFDDDEWERVFALIADDAAVDRAGVAARGEYVADFAPDGAASLLAIYEDAIRHRSLRT